jgi:hypothetical protein
MMRRTSMTMVTTMMMRMKSQKRSHKAHLVARKEEPQEVTPNKNANNNDERN